MRNRNVLIATECLVLSLGPRIAEKHEQTQSTRIPRKVGKISHLMKRSVLTLSSNPQVPSAYSAIYGIQCEENKRNKQKNIYFSQITLNTRLSQDAFLHHQLLSSNLEGRILQISRQYLINIPVRVRVTGN